MALKVRCHADNHRALRKLLWSLDREENLDIVTFSAYMVLEILDVNHTAVRAETRNWKSQIPKCHKTAKDLAGHMKTNENLLWVFRKLTFIPWQSDKQANNVGTARGFNVQKYRTLLQFLQKQTRLISCHYKHMQGFLTKKKELNEKSKNTDQFPNITWNFLICEKCSRQILFPPAGFFPHVIKSFYRFH